VKLENDSRFVKVAVERSISRIFMKFLWRGYKCKDGKLISAVVVVVEDREVTFSWRKEYALSRLLTIWS